MKIPTELLDRKQWVVRTAKKVPFSPLTKTPASCTDPSHWSTYREACLSLNRYFIGLSFALTPDDPYVALDIDNCIDGSTVSDFALDVILRMNSYTEVSPSGKGIRILVKATLPPGGRKHPDLEMYDRDRFVSLTGDHVAGTPTTIEGRTCEVRSLHQGLFPKAHYAAMEIQGSCCRRISSSDEDLLERARRSNRLFAEAWAGNCGPWGDDHSRADLYLCGQLRFWTGADRDRMQHLFRLSGLMRDKWDKRHGQKTYGEMTIDKALANG